MAAIVTRLSRYRKYATERQKTAVLAARRSIGEFGDFWGRSCILTTQRIYSNRTVKVIIIIITIIKGQKYIVI